MSKSTENSAIDREENPHEVKTYDELVGRAWDRDHRESPERLYHYTSAGALSPIVENGRMWASAFDCMNDDGEFRYGFGMALAEAVAQIDLLQISHASEIKENWKKFLESEQRSPRLRPYVLSFCESRQNGHLWKAYAGDSGGCMEFGNSKKFTPYSKMVRVDYSSAETLRSFRKDLAELVRIFGAAAPNLGTSVKDEISKLLLAVLQVTFRTAIAMKSPEWSKEEEWRLVLFTSPGSSPNSCHGNIRFRTRNDRLVDYLEVDLAKEGLSIESIETPKSYSDSMKNSMRLLCGTKKPPIRYIE